jgi:hypothetical protein
MYWVSYITAHGEKAAVVIYSLVAYLLISEERGCTNTLLLMMYSKPGSVIETP